jgi:hypothetical protein
MTADALVSVGVAMAGAAMPQGQGDDALVATERLDARFAIGQVTLQVLRSPFNRACGDVCAAASHAAP